MKIFIGYENRRDIRWDKIFPSFHSLICVKGGKMFSLASDVGIGYVFCYFVTPNQTDVLLGTLHR